MKQKKENRQYLDDNLVEAFKVFSQKELGQHSIKYGFGKSTANNLINHFDPIRDGSKKIIDALKKEAKIKLQRLCKLSKKL